MLHSLLEELGRSSRGLCKPICSWSNCCRTLLGLQSPRKTGYCHRRILGIWHAIGQHMIGQVSSRAAHCLTGCTVSAWSWCTGHFLWCGSLYITLITKTSAMSVKTFPIKHNKTLTSSFLWLQLAFVNVFCSVLFLLKEVFLLFVNVFSSLTENKVINKRKSQNSFLYFFVIC